MKVRCITHTISTSWECRFQLWNAHSQRLEVHVKLDKEGFGKGIASPERIHGREEEAQGVRRLTVVWPALEVLNENPSRNIETEGDERIHLNPLVVLWEGVDV